MRIFKIALATTGIGALVIGVAALAYELYELFKPIDEVTKKTRKYINEVKDEQIELNRLIASILNTNEGEAERLKLINELNIKYPFFNQFIKNEDTSNQNLKTALKQVNELYIKRIALKQLEVRLGIENKTQALVFIP